MATNDEVASHLGISPTRVSQLKSAGILPEARRRANNLDSCRVAYLEHLREIAAGRQSRDGGGLDLVEQRARLAAAQALMTERKNTIAEGEFLERRGVHIMATSSFAIVRSRLLGIAPKVAPYLVGIATPAKAQEIVKNEIYDVLDALAATDLADYDHVIELAADKVDADLKTDEGTEP
jgi:phage terminase Nu1 subunit (DNA packaging protein)